MAFSQDIGPAAATGPPAAGLAVSKLWSLDRYARFIPIERSEVLQNVSDKPSNGKWQHYLRNDHPNLNLSLIESNHLMITDGDRILESMLLWEAHTWIKAFASGDSMLFVYKQKGQNRRFRIKFLSLSVSVSSSDICRSVAETLKPLLPVKIIDNDRRDNISNESTQLSQSNDGCSQMILSQEINNNNNTDVSNSSDQLFKPVCLQPNRGNQPIHVLCTDVPTVCESDKGDYDSRQSQYDGEGQSHDGDVISIDKIAQDVLSLQPRPLGRAYADAHLPTEQLSSFIRLCLSDASFPAFVEAVEKELNNL